MKCVGDFTRALILFLPVLLFFLIAIPLEAFSSDDPGNTGRSDPPQENRTLRQIQSADSAVVNGEPSTPMIFGSKTVLDACWSWQALRGRPQEREVTKRHPLLYGARPQKTTPKNMRSPLKAEWQNSIRCVKSPGRRKSLALTFDLCESPKEVTGYDGEIVDYLREHSVKATFFAGGLWMLSHPERTMQLMADPLFEVGNHSWSHRDFRLLDITRMEEQIFWTQAQYELLWEELGNRVAGRLEGPTEMQKIPGIPLTFRFPYGTCNDEALALLARSGLPAIQWSVVTGDADRKQTAQTIAQVVLKQIEPGSIIICHANGRNPSTAKALTLFIPKLRDMGYDFVTVTELLSLGRVFAGPGCYELQPGDVPYPDRKGGKVK